ncbi:zinc ribbon domain-containing protein [Bifidobacterium boum]
MAYCTEYGQKIDDGIKFCPNCGASLQETRLQIVVEQERL